MNKLTIAIIAATLTAAPAFASEAGALPQSVNVTVPTNGLNLTDPRDVARLQSRVEKAIAAACNPRTSYSVYFSPDRQCASKAVSDSQQIVARMTREAAKSRMAEF